ncbi:keratinocyte differentiation factor 1-like [Scleropages formosus]|uniref:keratinocyte differentiation factor 1-like n=1 Tax=Scleropages formosus TaxID=113540 RepID=UPI0010FAB13C|nr:keratinocyte differentiation factor 1-like [Scleropages formosus]
MSGRMAGGLLEPRGGGGGGGGADPEDLDDLDAASPGKGFLRDANGRGFETIGFVPGSVESVRGARLSCASCSAPTAAGCRATACCLLTCGLYRACGRRLLRAPCLRTEEDEAAKPRPRPEGPVLREPGPLPSSSFRYPDVQVAGKRVPLQPPRASPPKRASSRRAEGKPRASVYSLEEPPDDGSEDGMDVDSLIAKKLLELYTQHQIEQLARCTSDSVFLSRTSHISQLIGDIQREHDLREEDAECRLVHGIIRLSARKHPGKGHGPKGTARRDETLPDSGNDTMADTTCSFDTEHEVKISEQTSTDRAARDMRASVRRAPSFGSPVSYSPTRPDPETASSGTPLLRLLSPA